MPMHNKTIDNVYIALDGKTFVRCHFKNCELNYSGLMRVGLKECTFEECKWTFSGAAKNTVNFMARIYSLGDSSAKVVETAFDQIRIKAASYSDTQKENDILN